MQNFSMQYTNIYSLFRSMFELLKSGKSPTIYRRAKVWTVALQAPPNSSKPSKGEILTTPVQFSRSVMSDSLRPHESQHTRPPGPSPTPGVHPNSRASSRWCHPAISTSVVLFSCPQSLPASGSFPMSQLFASGGQIIGVSVQYQSFQWILRTDFL